WCSDDFKNYPSSVKNHQIDELNSPYKILRGGSWYSSASDCRVSTRIYNEPKSKADVYGFRLALSK
ncbi:MAG: SUMF1/EgtB/PvdO family nonheme iron enzyme, partial [Alphaproteobacteria bacterium]|nr:SUMF1/EgtB/PvdO family nonheme iron enzyme [Alphaproteobacteria bacterium]